ncbi:MAG: SCO family protein [Vicinamibacterales bacterium]
MRRTWASLAVVACLAAGCGRAETPPAGAGLPPLPEISPLEFTLTDQDEKPFVLSSLRGKVVLVFFGYTMCPDACPTTLSKLSSAYARLTPDERARVKTLYISVDPDRDTPAVMKDHLTYFGVDAYGLTGPEPAIRDVASKFGVHYEKSTTPTAGGYSMAHTVSIFGLNAAGRPAKIIRYESSVDEVLADVRALLAEG